MAGRRKFSREFKADAVRMLVREGNDPVQLAKELGLRPDMLRRWQKQFELDGEEAFPGSGRLKPADEEVRALRSELRRVREERDILKKAMAIFSEPQR